MKSKRIPFFAVLLIALMIFQSVGALYGAISLFLAPDGHLLQMPLTFLENTPFGSYLVPSIILGIILGIFPLISSLGLIFRPEWKWASVLNIYADRHFGWTYAIYTGIMLNIWIITQVQMIGYGHFIQTIYGALSVLILICALMPSVMKYYLRQEVEETGKWRTL